MQQQRQTLAPANARLHDCEELHFSSGSRVTLEWGMDQRGIMYFLGERRRGKSDVGIFFARRIASPFVFIAFSVIFGDFHRNVGISIGFWCGSWRFSCRLGQCLQRNGPLFFKGLKTPQSHFTVSRSFFEAQPTSAWYKRIQAVFTRSLVSNGSALSIHAIPRKPLISKAFSRIPG